MAPLFVTPLSAVGVLLPWRRDTPHACIMTTREVRTWASSTEPPVETPLWGTTTSILYKRLRRPVMISLLSRCSVESRRPTKRGWPAWPNNATLVPIIRLDLLLRLASGSASALSLSLLHRLHSVTARRIAQAPKVTFVTGVQPASYRPNRSSASGAIDNFPGGVSRLRGALPETDVSTSNAGWAIPRRRHGDCFAVLVSASGMTCNSGSGDICPVKGRS
jgi:hypothetical protein